jgi:hypothetical protein
MGSAEVMVVPLTGRSSSEQPFSLWRIRGRKALHHHADALQLCSTIDSSVARLRLSHELADSAPFGYVLPADEGFEAHLLAVRDVRATYQPATRVPMSTAIHRPLRDRVLHARALQAFDGQSAGASQREMAEVLFGRDTVAGSWSSDSDVRAQVRHVLKRARHYIDGGYLELLNTRNRGGKKRP